MEQLANPQYDRRSEDRVKLLVKLEFRDDTEEFYDCTDVPSVGDWIVLYLADGHHTRRFIPRETIKSVEYGFNNA